LFAKELTESASGRLWIGKIRACFYKSCVAETRSEDYTAHMKTILAPIDFSRVSDSVVNEATALARALEGHVVLLAVIQPPVVINEYAVMIDHMSEITAAGERNAARQLEKLEERIKGEFVDVESVQVVGAPVPNILEQADRCHADYIVMGSHGHTAFYDLLVGSTTHGVLMRAKCPVVIVPSAQDKTSAKRKHESRQATV
jgi:nucleotide-binding universal stress UspA family protein